MQKNSNCHLIGIDLGGTSTKLGLFDSDGTLLFSWAISTRIDDMADIFSKILPARSAKHSPAGDFLWQISRESEWGSLVSFYLADT